MRYILPNSAMRYIQNSAMRYMFVYIQQSALRYPKSTKRQALFEDISNPNEVYRRRAPKSKVTPARVQG